jgi:transcriptional regulator with XRE-family HTH domain
MSKNRMRRVGNRLAFLRRRRSLRPKQVAALLGHKSTIPLSYYENGLRIPNIKNALKLAAIYNIPVRVMLDDYYEACLFEVKNEKVHRAALGELKVSESPNEDGHFERCVLEETLAAKKASTFDIDKARRHTSDLIRLIAEKLDHLKPVTHNPDEKP